MVFGIFFDWFIGILIVVFILYLITIYNGFVNLKNNYKKAWANIDVLLKQRNDELPNLISTVKGYMKHERKVLENITKARTNIMKTSNIHKKAEYNDEISESVKTLFAVSENYPKLKASENFLKLQTRISGLENAIADRREFFNDSVNNYNIRIQSFPDFILAKLFGFKEEERFVAQASEKENPSVNFNN